MKQSLPKKSIFAPSILTICYMIFIHLSQLFTEAQVPVQVPPESIAETINQSPIVENVAAEFHSEKVIIDAEKKTKTFEEEYGDEPYIYLLHEIEVEVKEDWTHKTTIHKKIKIQKPGHKNIGTIPFRYIKGREKITKIEAYTIAANGEKYSHIKIQDRSVDRGYKSYSDEREKIITLPKVSVGAILDYTVVREFQGKTIEGAFWKVGYLDFGVPTKQDKCSVSFPKSLDIAYKEFNLEYKPVIYDDGVTVKYVWDVQNTHEPYDDTANKPFPTHENLTNIFMFSSIKNWSDVSDWYYDLASKNVVITEEMRKEAANIFEGKETLTQKTLALLEYFNDKFRYISMSFGENTFEPHRTDEVFKNKYGDCKDISLLFKTMLELGGVESSLALFTEEETSSDPQYDLPIPGLFDHVLLLVHDPEEGDFYLDPLLEGYFPGEYPLSFQGAYTFIINEHGGKFDKLPIFDEYRQYEAKAITYDIKNDGSSMCEYINLWGLDFSISMRKKIKSDSVTYCGHFRSVILSEGEARVEGSGIRSLKK